MPATLGKDYTQFPRAVDVAEYWSRTECADCGSTHTCYLDYPDGVWIECECEAGYITNVRWEDML